MIYEWFLVSALREKEKELATKLHKINQKLHEK